MKLRSNAIIILAAIMLMGTMLTGCSDRNDEGGNVSEQYQQSRPQSPRGEPDPNRPPPERNPDGTLG